jgi:hypothetical protein
MHVILLGVKFKRAVDYFMPMHWNFLYSLGESKCSSNTQKLSSGAKKLLGKNVPISHMA